MVKNLTLVKLSLKDFTEILLHFSCLPSNAIYLEICFLPGPKFASRRGTTVAAVFCHLLSFVRAMANETGHERLLPYLDVADTVYDYNSSDDGSGRGR